MATHYEVVSIFTLVHIPAAYLRIPVRDRAFDQFINKISLYGGVLFLITLNENH
jgi:hypothetical protein